MADTPQHSQSTYGGKPPLVAKPRTSGHLPWDQDRPPKGRSSKPPPQKTPPGELQYPGQVGYTPPIEDSVLSEEKALLEELDEVLSSTTGSKSSKSTTESRVSDLEIFSIEETKVERISAAEWDYKGQHPGGRGHSWELPVPVKEEEEEREKREEGKEEEGGGEEKEEEDKMWGQDEDLAVTGRGFGQEKPTDARVPRYGGRQFTNYEEMLDNMDSDDPYSKEPSPYSHKKPPASKPKPKTKQSKKQAKTAAKQLRNGDPVGEDGGSKKKQRSVKKGGNNETKISTNSDGRMGIENPAYEGKDRTRRNSTESNRTYVLGINDSRAALIDEKGNNKTDTPTRRMSVDVKGGKDGGGMIAAGVAPTLGLGTGFVLNPLLAAVNNKMISGRQFIKERIKHRRCSRFIPKGDSNSPCGCGLSKPLHHPDALENQPAKNEKWTTADHTQRVEADSFGMIAFQGFGHEISDWAPYVRIDENMRHKHLNDLWLLLSDVWKMPPPKMIVSVTGGAKRFFMKNRIRNSFQRGLINVATSSGAWIVTGGTGTGVMQFVGEAVREYQLAAGTNRKPVVALGITSWGTVDNKEALVSQDKNGLSPATYHMDCLTYAKKTAPLDPNHTHFILVDDGTTSQFGKEIKFRAGLERFISNTGLKGIGHRQGCAKGRESSSKSVTHVPVVLLVLEGGVNTLKTTLEAIKENTPIVVIQGSGRAADIIALGYKETKGGEDLDLDLQNQRALDMFDWSRASLQDRESEIEKCVTYLKEILSQQNRHLVTVFHIDDVDTTKEIDEAILYALLKAEGSKAESQLNLAIAWNRCDIARQQIFDYGVGTKIGKIGKAHMEESMMTALLQNSSDFVQLFLDNGFDLTSFLTKRTLRSLYDEVLGAGNVDRSAALLKNQLLRATTSRMSMFSNFRRESWNPNQESMLRSVGRVINSLLGDYGENLYRGAENVISPNGDYNDGRQTISTVEGGKVISETQNETQSSLQLSLLRSNTGYAERDLFLWAVLFNRQELAHVFWKAGKDHIGGALIASSLLKSLGDYATDEEEIDLAQELYQASVTWEEMAVGVLNECYLRDKEMSHDLLVREIDTWANSTLMVIADSAEQMDFMGHSCCQTKLNRIWKGKMALYTSTWKIITCMLLPFFLPTIRFYTGEFASLFRPVLKAPSSPKKLALGSMNKVGQYTGESGSYQNGESHGSYQGGESMSRTSSFWKIMGYIYYYHTAPVTKFCYHVSSYVIFLGLFSYFILTDLHPVDQKSPSYIEYIVWGWAGTLFLEEIRQIATKSPRKLLKKLAGYFDSVWNQYDLINNAMFIITIILRYTLSGDSFEWARMAYAITMAMYFLRFMQFFYVEKNIGPKVIMIRRMLTDLLFFVAIMITVILAYGIAVQSLMYPNSEPRWSLLKDILYKPYWNIYGELFLEDFEGKTEGCSSDRNIWSNATAGVDRCPRSSWLATSLFVIYMILTNILLLNLLIAMFSYTFERVQENSEKVWRYFRYSLVYEYYDKPTLAPPLIIFSHIWRTVKYFLIRCHCRLTYETDFRKKMERQRGLTYTAFERAGMDLFLLKQNKSSREHINAKVNSTSDKIEKVIEDLEHIKEQVSTPQVAKELDQTISLLSSRSPEKFNGPRASDVKAVQDRVEKLESKLTDQGSMLHKMMSYMEDLHKNQTAVKESSSRGRHHHGDEVDHQGVGLDDHVSRLQGQLNEHAYVMEKLMTIVEDMSPSRARPESGRPVTPTQVNYRQGSTNTPGGSVTGVQPYRRGTYTTDPTIEIQNLQLGNDS